VRSFVRARACVRGMCESARSGTLPPGHCHGSGSYGTREFLGTLKFFANFTSHKRAHLLAAFASVDPIESEPQSICRPHGQDH